MAFWRNFMMQPTHSTRTGYSRRKFLRGSLGAALPILALPASTRGAKLEKMRLGVIGTGGQGTGHAGMWSSLPESRVVALCDVNRKHLAAAKATVDKNQGDASCATCGDFRELIARPDIEAVSIAVPDHWHALIALQAIRAGKHVYLEKPLAYTVEEGRALVDAVRQYGVGLQHGTQQRSMDTFQRAAWLARSGRLGRLQTATATSRYGPQGGDPTPAEPPPEIDYEFWLGPAPRKPYTPGRCSGHGGLGWYHIRDYSGGWVTAWGSHHVDCAQWALGKDAESPVRVEANGEFPVGGVYDTCWKWRADVTYADGMKLIFATPGEAKGKWTFSSRATMAGSAPRARPSTPTRNRCWRSVPARCAKPGLTTISKISWRPSARAAIPPRPWKAPTSPPPSATWSTSGWSCNARCNGMAPTETSPNDPVANRMLTSTMRAPWKLHP